MFLHALTTTPQQPPYSWWAIHVESLTPVKIHIGSGGRIALDIVSHPPSEIPAHSSHPDSVTDPAALTHDLLTELTATLTPHYRLHRSRVVTREDSAVPEFLLVFDHSGAHPAIARTQDPRCILPADPHDESSLSASFLAARTTTDLSADGWAYFWEDCQRAYDQLAPALVAASSANDPARQPA